MKIAHLNVRSLISGFNDFRHLVYENEFDIVALSETWLSNDIDSDIISLQGYNLFRKDRTGRGGGVALYLKTSFNCEVVSLDSLANNNLFEHLWVKFKANHRTFLISSIYRPPHNNLTDCLSDLEDMLSFVTPTFDVVVCLGDLNVDLFNVDNPISNCFNSYNYVQLINEPTRITSNSSTLIDPIFISNNELVTHAGTLLADMISDHRMVHCSLDVKSVKFKQKFVTFRDFSNFGLDVFQTYFRGLPLDDIIYEPDINKKVDLLNNFIISSFDIFAPVKTVRVSKPKAPWLTDNIKLIIKEKQRALNRYKLTKQQNDWEYYKQVRNFSLAACRAEKKAYINNICQQNNLKKTWATLSKFNINNKNKDNAIPDQLNNPNLMNDFFLSVMKPNDALCQDSIDHYENNKYNANLDFRFKMVTEQQVHDILFSLKSNACGTDNISAAMLQYCSPFIDIYLTHIINYAIEVGSFPELWKVAIGCPLPKKQNPSDMSDIRIISLLPCISKILEKVMFNQMYEFLNSNDILPAFQTGFRKYFSTSMALAQVTDDLLSAMDKNKVSVLVLLDFSKAFDTINHKLICSKLKYYGFDYDSVAFIKSYLTNRQQQIRIHNRSSDLANIEAGVPQGSVIGPLLFILYTADILKCIRFSKVQAYADDSQIYFSFSIENIIAAQDCINSDLDMLYNKCQKHNLKMNAKKSHIMVFGAKSKVNIVKNSISIKIDNNPLPVVSASKNLGLIIDDDFRFESHVDNLLKKSYCSMKLLYSNRFILNGGLKKVLCESLVLSVFNYCDFIYGPCLTLTYKKRIQKVQNFCVRYIYGLRKFDHVSQKINELKWLNMENRRFLHINTFVHKLLNSNIYCSLNSKLIRRSHVHNINIRQTDTFTLPHHSTAIYQRSFTYNAVKSYNKLLPSIKSLKPPRFKYHLKHNLLLSQ